MLQGLEEEDEDLRYYGIGEFHGLYGELKSSNPSITYQFIKT